MLFSYSICAGHAFKSSPGSYAEHSSAPLEQQHLLCEGLILKWFCLSVSCELVSTAQEKSDSNGTTSLDNSTRHTPRWEKGSFHGKRENGLIIDVSTTYLAVRFPSYFMSCTPESYPKGLKRHSVSRPTGEPPRVSFLCLRSKGKKNYIYIAKWTFWNAMLPKEMHFHSNLRWCEE